MIRGKTIQTYLPDGNPQGIKICEITSRITKGILIPRNKIAEIDKLDEISKELNKVGIYFLFSDKDNLSQFKTYIGEAENLFKRINQHDSSEEEWEYVVCFLSSKNNLNKAHAKFLEAFCYESAEQNKNNELINEKRPTKSNLTKQEEDLALDFFDDLKIIIGNLGYPLFDKLNKKDILGEIFYCKEVDASAEGNLIEEGFIVYKGSKLKSKKPNDSWILGMVERLKEKNILVDKNGILTFSEDFTFNSPSASAGVILGRRANGWIAWKNKENKTLDEVKRRKIQ